MAFIEKKKQGNKNIWIFKYYALSHWLIWLTILVTLLTAWIIYLWLLAGILGILLISSGLPYWETIPRFKKAIKEKNTKVSGSKYSFSNPLRYEWED